MTQIELLNTEKNQVLTKYLCDTYCLILNIMYVTLHSVICQRLISINLKYPGFYKVEFQFEECVVNIIWQHRQLKIVISNILKSSQQISAFKYCSSISVQYVHIAISIWLFLTCHTVFEAYSWWYIYYLSMAKSKIFEKHYGCRWYLLASLKNSQFKYRHQFDQ
jgi:hypothetical protein